MLAVTETMRQQTKARPLQLLVGLGNPGPTYADTRHNVGQVWIESLAARHDITLREDAKFHGRVGRGDIAGHDVRLLVPTTWMNLSGDAVAALTRFFKIDPAHMLVAHDELAFEPGTVRLKTGGGTNGHNGLKDIIPKLGSRDDFHRLRIGVGHPGAPEKVANYLTSARIPDAERDKIDAAVALKPTVLKALMAGEIGRAMNLLHARPKKNKQHKQQDKERTTQAEGTGKAEVAQPSAADSPGAEAADLRSETADKTWDSPAE